MRRNNYFLCTLYMKFGKYVMKNKTCIIILLVSLLVLHSSGLLDNLLGLREKVLIEGAKGKKSEKELRIKERKQNIKAMKKAVKQVEKEVAQLKKQKETMGITSEERDLALQIIDHQIKTFEFMAGAMLFRGSKPGQNVFDTPTKAFFSAYTYAANQYQMILGRPGNKPGKGGTKMNQNDPITAVNIYMTMLGRLKKMRKLVANMEVVD